MLDSEVWNACASPWNDEMICAGHAEVGGRLGDGVDRLPERDARAAG